MPRAGVSITHSLDPEILFQSLVVILKHLCLFNTLSLIPSYENNDNGQLWSTLLLLLNLPKYPHHGSSLPSTHDVQQQSASRSSSSTSTAL